MKPETFSSGISCPQCRRRGIARWERRSYQKRLFDTLSAGFVWIDRGEAGDPHIVCKSCHERANEEEPSQQTQWQRAA